MDLIRKVDFDWYEKEFFTLQDNDTLHVVNFWATWCKPCVSELPYFEELRKKYKTSWLKFTYISLDFSSEIKPVTHFANTKELGGQVVLLSGGNQNEWIPKVDKSWIGAIPATVIYKGGKKLDFHEGELKKEDLEQMITNYLKQ